MLQGFRGVGNVDPVYWTLAVELVFYAIVGLALLTRMLDQIKWVLLGWLVVSLLLEMQGDGFGQVVLATRWSAFFVAGACLGLLRARGFMPSPWQSADLRWQPRWS